MLYRKMIQLYICIYSFSNSFQLWLIAQMVKNLPIVQETLVQFLGWEGPLEKEMANHSSILAWKIPWTEEPGGLQSMGCKDLDVTEHTRTHTGRQLLS